MAVDENLLANPEEEKPEPPPDFDEEAVKQNVNRNFSFGPRVTEVKLRENVLG
jgi:hypothetical protein